MGLDYALVLLKYVVPPTVLLTLIYWPLFTQRDIYKILFLVVTAVVSTVPWDSYIIQAGVWTYAPGAVIGLTFRQVPVEEICFVIVQTYATSVLYLLCSKPTFHSIYLCSELPSRDRTVKHLRLWKRLGQFVLLVLFIVAASATYHGGVGTYMGLIAVWTAPILLLLWSLSYQMLLRLPWTNTILPIGLSTGYLWLVDTVALREGTWVIQPDTKLCLYLWPHLEIEEAVFWAVTNCLIVFGLVAFDNVLAVIDTFSPFAAPVSNWPSPLTLIHALLTPTAKYDEKRLQGLRDGVERLQRKSRSFFLASGAFDGKIRIYLIILYSFCRVADDLVDEATSTQAAMEWISKLRKYLDLSYGNNGSQGLAHEYVRLNFPAETHSAFNLLPTAHLSRKPLDDLLDGFVMDLKFDEAATSSEPALFPIQNQEDLDLYGARVAGTVAQLCLEIVFAQIPGQVGREDKDELIRAGNTMGIALQYVNISRDITTDALLRRVYIPSTWLADEGLTPAALIKNPDDGRVEKLRMRLLDRAFALHHEAKDAVAKVPVQVRGPMRVTVESYMEIGRVLRTGKYRVRAGRATVPKWRKLWVAWKTLRE